MANLLEKLLRAGEGKILRELESIVESVNSLEVEFEAMSDDELREYLQDLKKRVIGEKPIFDEEDIVDQTKEDEVSQWDDQDLETFDEDEINDDKQELQSRLEAVEAEVYAIVREAAKRTIGQRHFDVQIMGGAALHRGMISEMKTGEGKTLVATLPVVLNALTAKGVHVVTVNDYLASYQSELMGRIYRFLGLSVGCITNNLETNKRKLEYEKDIVYGTNNEFGFDYLRDNMCMSKEQQVQRGFYFAIVDEVDSILIDEARTPLIISGESMSTDENMYKRFNTISKQLLIDEDYEVDRKKKTVGILDKGIEKIEKLLGVDNLYASTNVDFVGYINNAIRAKELFDLDKDYIVENGELKIVDEHTGRVLDGRRFSEGMHQALEAKENVEIKKENQTYATVTLQNYFRMYDKLGGMTGTAETEAAEFMSTYKLTVVPIPPNKPMIRQDKPDFVYRTEKGKYQAMIKDINERYAKGQPVLIGTASVEKSEVISNFLKEKGIPHNLLNAKNHKHEAELVARAGEKGAITVATNMAGRGTDIMLGGNSEFLAIEEMSKKGFDPIKEPEIYNENWPKFLEQAEKKVKEEHDEVIKLGGLYVLGTERHESRRIDNQLRGRSGRQGDPGESRFYISFEDDLMKLFNSDMAKRMMALTNFPEDTPLESKMVSKSIMRAQSQVEGRNFEIRKNILKYDDVMNNQRKIVYKERQLALEGKDLFKTIKSFIREIFANIVNYEISQTGLTKESAHSLLIELKNLCPIDFKILQVDELELSLLNEEIIVKSVLSEVKDYYISREEIIGKDNMRSLERQIVLSILDKLWRENLYEVDYLREGIGLRAFAQKDPLVEYKSETARLFNEMNYKLKEETLRYLLNLPIGIDEENQAIVVGYDQKNTIPLIYSSAETGDVSDEGTLKKERENENISKPKVKQARKIQNDGEFFGGTKPNDQCPCSSGKKYKMCHGKNDPNLKK